MRAEHDGAFADNAEGILSPGPERRRPAHECVGAGIGGGMSTMNSEIYGALIDAGADEAKAREAAKSVAQYDSDMAEIKASLLVLKWMVGFILAFVVALTWRAFQ